MNRRPTSRAPGFLLTLWASLIAIANAATLLAQGPSVGPRCPRA